MRFRTIVTLAVIISTVNTATAQILNDIRNHLRKGSLANLIEFRSHYYKSIDDGWGDICSFYWHYYREVVPHHFEGLILINDCVRSDSNTSIQQLEVKILVKDSTIYYYSIDTNPNDNFTTDLYSQMLNKSLYKELLTDYSRIFGISLNTSELFTLVPLSISGCGMDGIPLEPMIRMTQWIKRKDRNSIKKWLLSPNTEKQLYAVYGLKTLADISPEENQLIRYIINKKGTVQACIGCNSDQMRIDEIIKSEFSQFEIVKD